MLSPAITITCQNPSCAYFQTESGKYIRRNGHNSAGTQQYHCVHCNSYFVETKHTPLYRSHLSRSKVEEIGRSSVESVSIRVLSRIMRVTQTTISRYYRLIGEHAYLLNERYVHDISPGICEMDEIWSFVHKKQKKIKKIDPSERGDVWTYIALKRYSGFLIAFVCGKRTQKTCEILFDCLFDAMKLPFPDNPICISTDGNFQYLVQIQQMYCETCVVYGIVRKVKSANRLIKVTYEHVIGDAQKQKISTSVVEGYNNKIRQKLASFGRKTAAFSKQMKSFIDRLNIFQWVHNFMEKKKGGNRTPAMIENKADSIWTWEEFLNHHISY